MAIKYRLSLAADFGGSFDSDNWVAEVGASIATPIDHVAPGVSTEGDIIDTWFVSALSPAEEATFLALPASHYPLWREPTTTVTLTSVDSVSSTSKKYKAIDGMEVTPSAGTYEVIFSGSIENTKDNSKNYICITVDNSEINDSVRRSSGLTPFRTSATVTVDGTETIYGEAKTSKGTMTIYEREFQLKRV